MDDPSYILINTEEDFKNLCKSTNKKIFYRCMCLDCNQEYKNQNLSSVLYSRYLQQTWSLFNLCRPCRIKRGRIKNNVNEKEALEKRRRTCLEKYGVDNPFKDSKKIQKAFKDKYGVTNPSQLTEVKKKKRNTCFEHYGVPSATQTREVQQKIKETNLERYGYSNPNRSSIIKEKIRQTNRIRYGVDNYNQTLESRERQRKIWKDPQKRKQLSKKCSETWLSKSKEEIHKIRSLASKKYMYDNIKFDSSWELALWIYAKDHNEPIEREPCCFEYEFENKKKTYILDFKYKGQLIEIKGDQYLSLPVTQKKLQVAKDNNVHIWTLKDIQSYLQYMYKKEGKFWYRKYKYK